MVAEAITTVTREVIANRLSSLTQEMGLSMVRTAYSVLFAECRDFSCVLFDYDARVVALASFVPLHQGGIAGSMEYVLDKWGLEGLEEGDVVMHNDALNKGSHPSDITLFSPILYDGTLVAIGSSAAHHNDTGGMRPSSYCPDADEIYQEGIRFPAVKLFRRGELQRDILDTYLTNVRGAELERGDLYAQLSTFAVAERGVKELCRKYGVDGFKRYCDGIQDASEQRMWESIKAIPEGTYEAEDYQDHDGWEARSWTVRVKVTVKHTPTPKIIVDFTGTDPQVRGFVNSYYNNTRASIWAGVFAMVDPHVHKCAGAVRPVEIINPPGTLTNANPPAALGACTTEIGFVAIEIITEALAKARPEAASGVWGGTFCCFYAFGENPRRLKQPRIKPTWTSLFADPGTAGGGARATKDGIGSTTPLGCGPITMPNVEIMELNYPVLYRYKRLITDGGGAGKFRGSPTYEQLVQPEGPLQAPLRFTSLANKGYHGAPGVFGGREGSRFRQEIRDPITDKTIRELAPKVSLYPCAQTEGIYTASPGGGGYGNPWERDVNKVREDVIEGYVSVKGAKEDYGVVIDPKTLEIDREATEGLRNRMNREAKSNAV